MIPLDNDENTVKQALRLLLARYENVLILANRHNAEENHTETIAGVRGNSFAVLAHAQQWIYAQTCGADDDDDDDGEAWKKN